MTTESTCALASARPRWHHILRFIAPLLVCVLCLSHFLSCGSDSPTRSDEPDVLMPLATGNTWTYSFIQYGTEQGSLSLTVLGTTVHLDETYHRLSEPYLAEGQPGLDRYTVMRNGADGLYWCDDVCSSPEGGYPASCDGALYQYPTTDGAEYTDVDTCRCSEDDPVTLVIETVAIQVTFEEVEVPAGTFDVISYACTELGAAETWTYSFAPEVGLVLVSVERDGTDEGALELASYSLK